MSSTVESSQATFAPARIALPLEYPATVLVSRPLDEIRVVEKSDDRLVLVEDERLHRYTALLSASVVVVLVLLIQLIVGFGDWVPTMWLWAITAVTLTIFLICIRPFGVRMILEGDEDQPKLTIHKRFLGYPRETHEVDLSEFMLSKGCRAITAVGGNETIFTCVAVHPDDDTRSLHLVSSCKEGVIDRILNRIEGMVPTVILAGQHMEPDSRSRPAKPR